ncbi:hypothetical protein VFPPC_14708 [Pochonia chlamydosporia 170]|uniref:Small secreted protein n=1 Tax=Pochonia chlamydosporia 170 TaxID=1380566 RepID=A0A179F3C9_METCM|nr:hypothetical protein VFPPC_14708 [Pochonia chlamydosporia 170]OAQ59926.1 hypothetical protein VFPPC_14708 [Pochonia chlamydosporia 170]
MQILNAILASLTFSGLVMAECRFENIVPKKVKQETAKQLCMTQGEGDWTFAMATSLSVVPSLSSDASNGLAGASGGATFIIYDNNCMPRAVYDAPSCGVPYVAKENFLKWVLSVNTVDMGVGSPYFSFTYAAGKYSIRNNHCVCSDMSHGLTGAKGCRCAFPVKG